MELPAVICKFCLTEKGLERGISFKKAFKKGYSQGQKQKYRETLILMKIALSA